MLAPISIAGGNIYRAKFWPEGSTPLDLALAARAAKVASGRTDARGAAVVQVGSGKLARRSSYIVAVRRADRLVTSAQGVVR